ncbi:hypothetical protein [Natronobacterium texcoconense]|uniref:Uncharacterized protein n=1 Tax=Natronobacterium texcoconense TaxID=1095778 RepID=A0A1H1GSX2_NATTX|nr:hypothetical protein [Natronobacterium texcoconense]SDR16314.1 hypothetical protein SAMN04489842_2593 [Natronobacterium texcoconense]
MGMSGSIDPAVVPVLLQIDATIAVAAIVTVAMAAFSVFLLYLAFGSHARSLESPTDRSGASVDEDSSDSPEDVADAETETEPVNERGDSAGGD